MVKQAEDAEKLTHEEKLSLEQDKLSKDKSEKNEFKDDYEFDTLKEDLLKYIETPAVCKKFIDYLKKNDFTMLLVRVLEDEEMEDVLIDNPYLVKLV